MLIDPSHLEQVVLNLATNAKDAMPSGGTFRLRTRIREHGTPEGSRDFLELTALDSGVGMTAEQVEHIFDPFYTTKEQGRGTGLGLATVYGVVHQADGNIWAESVPGTGSRFVVLLPLSAVERAPTGPHPAATRGTGRVLLVEDDAPLRSATTRALERAGYEVRSFGDPKEALEYVRGGEPFDAVVTDVVMPALSGPVLVSAIEAQRGPTPTVFVSGYAKTAQSQIGRHPGSCPSRSRLRTWSPSFKR